MLPAFSLLTYTYFTLQARRYCGIVIQFSAYFTPFIKIEKFRK